MLELSDGRLVSWSDGNSLYIWDLMRSDGEELVQTLAEHTGSVRGAIQLRDGHLLSWSYDLTIKLWDIYALPGKGKADESVCPSEIKQP